MKKHLRLLYFCLCVSLVFCGCSFNKNKSAKTYDSFDPIYLAIKSNNKGVSYFERGLYDHAVEQFKIAISFYPEMAEAYNNLGVVYNSKDMAEAAISQFNKSINIKADYADAHDNLEWLFAQQVNLMTR